MRKTHSPEQIIDILRTIEKETSQGKTALLRYAGGSRHQ